MRKAIATGRIAIEDDRTIDACPPMPRLGRPHRSGAHSRADAARTAAMTAAHATAKPVPRAAFEAVKETLRGAGAVEPGGEVSLVSTPNCNEMLV